MSKDGRDPFRALATLRDRMNDLLQGETSDLSALPEGLGSQWAPSTDVVETDNQILVALEVPGIEKENLHVQLDGNILTIKGERPSPQPEPNKVYLLERGHGAFTRVIHLPDKIEDENIQSKLDNGVLVVKLKKKKPRRIEVV
jgi:HSP20 family protein